MLHVPFPPALSPDAIAFLTRPAPVAPTSCSIAPLSWYVVQTGVRCEERAKRGLLEQGIEAFLPFSTHRVIRHRVKMKVDRPLFPRYIFVGTQPEGLEVVRKTDGVERIIKGAGDLMTVHPDVINHLKLSVIRGDFDDTIVRPEVPLYAEGTMVVVRRGPFAQLVAVIKAAPPEGRIQVIIELFGKRHDVEVDAKDVEEVRS